MPVTVTRSVVIRAPYEVGRDPRALESARPGLDVSVLDDDVGAEPGQALQVLVDGTPPAPADGAAAGQGDARHPGARQQRPEHDHRGAHGGHELVRRLVARDARHLQARGAAGLRGCLGAQPLEEPAHGHHVGQRGDVFEHQRLGRQEACGHGGQGRVLGGARLDFASERAATLDDEAGRHQPSVLCAAVPVSGADAVASDQEPSM